MGMIYTSALWTTQTSESIQTRHNTLSYGGFIYAAAKRKTFEQFMARFDKFTIS